MSVPDEVRDRLRDRLWALADRLDWLALGSAAKTQQYENWAKEPEIGGVLARYMDVRRVRVYIKDSLLKSYPRARLADARRPLRLLNLPEDAAVSHVFTKPHGLQLADGRIICWGPAAGWKAVLMAVHERAYNLRGRPFAAVLTQASARYGDDVARAVVADGAGKLGIGKLVWSP